MQQKILLYILFLFVGDMLYGQSFPVVITNTYQASGTSPLKLHIGSVTSGNTITFQVNTKLVASAAVMGPTEISPSNGSITSYWWQVDLPGTTAGVTAYCAAGATFTNPICNSSYITITAPSANISKTAGGTAFVTISGVTAKGFQGQHFGWNSSQTVGGVNWYQVGLPDNCSQTTGWISAASASLTNTNGSGLPSPVLSATVSGNSVDLSWTMNIQPTGSAQTVFTLYKSVNGGTPVPINIPTAPPDTYMDNSYSSSNSYTYYIQAGYGICTLLNSNTVNLPETVSSNGHIQVNISPVGINASWSLDGSGTYSSGASITAPYGSHTVSFSPVPGYTAPANQTITLSSANANPSINVTYTPAVACNYPPPPTGGISVTVSSSQIDLSWQAASGAASYRIYDCNGGYIGSSNTTSYEATDLQAGTLYSFKLTSVNSQGCESQVPSACFSSTTMSTVTKYDVIGKVTTSAGAGIAGVMVTTPLPQPQYAAITLSDGSYRISNIPASYSGSVSAILANYSFSPASLIISGTDDAGKNFTGTPITNCVYPPFPAGVQATAASATQINLTWQTSSGAASYKIYDCTSGNLVGISTTTSYPATGLQAATTYNYKIKSVNAQGCESQNYSSCAGATTQSNASSTYTISGKVNTSSGTAITGVTVSTGTYSALTDANGNYSIPNIPNSYSGAVNASLANYTFTPVNATVNSASNSGKNFTGTMTVSATSITYSAVTVAPWQRAGEDYQVTINATTSDASDWTITAYNNASPVPPVTSGSFKSGQTGTFNFNFTNSGGIITYSIQSVDKHATVTNLPPTYVTAITDAKWNNENKVYFNDSKTVFRIPIKYIPGTTSVSYMFTRVAGTSNAKDNIEIKASNLLPASAPYINEPYNLNPSSTNPSNIQKVNPGVFNCAITYNGSAYSENIRFDLTKIGKVSQPKPNGSGTNASRVMILIGGITNTVESEVTLINNYSQNLGLPEPSDLNSKMDMSIISYLNVAGYNTWYIAQPNENGVRDNAYDLGVAITMIQQLTQSSDINIICHSKGGLEIKALLGTTTNLNNLTTAVNGSSFNYAQSSISGLIKKVAFLATPHKGALVANLLSLFNNSEGLLDLVWDLSPNQICGILQKTAMPLSTKFLNLTDYGPSYIHGSDLEFLVSAAAGPLGDGAVNVLSSADFNPNNGDSFYQLFQDHSDHGIVHQNNTLSNYGLCTTGLKENIDYINDFFDGTLSQPCNVASILYSFLTIESVLSNARIDWKSNNNSLYQNVGFTDENGKLNLKLFNSFNIGDTIKITANGVDTEQFAVTPLFNSSHKLSIAMFPSNIVSNKLQLPSLSLVNQNPITNQATIQLKVTAKNAGKYLINVHNSDSLFVQAFAANNIIQAPLDTGYNKIMIKFIGTALDTAVLSKEVYYLPDTLMNKFSRNFTVSAPSGTTSKLFVNNNFYQDITGTTSFKSLKEVGEAKFSRFGFRDTTFTIDTISSINLQMQPVSYSSLTDSSIYDFTNRLNPQYWKNVSVKNISATSNVQVSAMQYDDPFTGLALQPQSRKFVFRNMRADTGVHLRTAIALDQAVTPNIDSVYLLSIKDGKYTKYQANVANLSEYDPIVQKLAFDSVRLKAKGVQEIALMRKLAPILLNPQSLEIVQCKQQDLPVSSFVANPDSIKNDLVVTSSNPNVTVNGNALHINAPFGTTGSLSFALSFTHDFITVSKTFSVMINPCPITPPNAFTPNGDGINDTWDIPNLTNFPNCTVDVFNRYGNLVYHSVGYGKAWNGSYNGQRLPAGVYYYIIEPKEPGYKTLTGNITIVR